MFEYEFPQNLTTLKLDTFNRSEIGKELSDTEWLAFAYYIEGVVEDAIENAVNEKFDSLDELVENYEEALFLANIEEEEVLF